MSVRACHLQHDRLSYTRGVAGNVTTTELLGVAEKRFHNVDGDHVQVAVRTMIELE